MNLFNVASRHHCFYLQRALAEFQLRHVFESLPPLRRDEWLPPQSTPEVAATSIPWLQRWTLFSASNLLWRICQDLSNLSHILERKSKIPSHSGLLLAAMGIDDVYILCTCCRVHSSQITQVLFRETDGKYLWLCKNTQTVTYRCVISLGYCDGIVFTSNQLLLQHFIFMCYCLHEWQKNNCPDSFWPLLLYIFVKHINSCLLLLLLFSSYTSTQLCVCMCIHVCV